MPINVWADNQNLKDIENYLNNITTFKADFQQYTPNEDFSYGTFYLKRPKKFLWQYKLPHKQKVVSTGKRLFFYDPETEQSTQLPLNSGFAAILNKKPFLFKDAEFKILGIKADQNFILINLTIKNNENKFSLKFNKNPISLLSMSSRDSFGQGINILFSNAKQGENIDDSLFNFKPELEKFND